ncbi:DUF4838 domain-containing protein [Arenibacter latericius]|uniref:DUF4838 domain-containing protein n=1 Tax=Arenibacter latericius TaxID=86104 RepID=UPI0004269E60|nr:DUF4838 domain-containing protein [Arenibacter latericius]
MHNDKWDTYIISSAQNEASEQWANYVFKQLSNRATEPNLVKSAQISHQKKWTQNHRIISINVSGNIEQNYCVSRERNTLQLQLKENGKLNQKIIEQLILKITHQDLRFTSADTPPSILSFKEGCHGFDFKYREPFYAPNLKPGNTELFVTNSIDIDWGIWGHNLKKLFANEKDSTLYALVDRKRIREQLCFSSTELYHNISNYILDNFGDGLAQGYQFMIAPQDNNLVCQGSTCLQLGNSITNATPAVTYLIRKLAKRYPKHQFFTIAYLTTLTAPTEKLPDNAGVFLSTIDLPKGVALDPIQSKTQTFLNLINDWKAKTSTIYLWDYASNFDDYLTPIPVLYSLQQQLRFYKEHNIKGIFLNASGYEYATFDGLKTFVSASLMIDNQQSIDALVQRYFKNYYPETHQLLTEYYIKLERDFAKKSQGYPLYGGANEILETYLDKDDFIQFYHQLEQALTKTKGAEKKRLHKLFTALSFTRLQIAYENGSNAQGFIEQENKTLTVLPEVKKWITNLEQYTTYKNLYQYRESSGDLAIYIQQWKNLISKKEFTNLLLDIPITIHSAPDEGFESSHLLNNGILGFTPDYHQGWYISSKDLKIGFTLPDTIGEKEVRIRFLTDSSHGFYPPDKIEIKADGQIIHTILSNELKPNKYTTNFSFSLDLKKGQQIEFHFIRKLGPNIKIACDEIQIF